MNQEIFDVLDEDFGFTYRTPTDQERLQKAIEICELHKILYEKDFNHHLPQGLEEEYGSISPVRWISSNDKVV